MTRLALFTSLALLAASPAQAQDAHGVAHQGLVLLLNPMGAQHELSLALRAPLGDQDALLFDGAHAEAGVLSRVAPVFAIQGGYLEVSPLSFLVLRAEFTAVSQWPIGMNGAGYYAVANDDDPDVQNQTLAADDGGSATGWSVRVSGQLQGAVPLSDSVRLLLVDRVSFQHDDVGDASHYYSLEHDLILARSDWVLHNDALLLAEVEASRELVVRAGVYSDLRWVPRSGYVGHQAGPLVALTFRDVSPEVSSITAFVRGGFYTDHVSRAQELTVLGGVSVDYALGAL